MNGNDAPLPQRAFCLVGKDNRYELRAKEVHQTDGYSKGTHLLRSYLTHRKEKKTIWSKTGRERVFLVVLNKPMVYYGYLYTKQSDEEKKSDCFGLRWVKENPSRRNENPERVIYRKSYLPVYRKHAPKNLKRLSSTLFVFAQRDRHTYVCTTCLGFFLVFLCYYCCCC